MNRILVYRHGAVGDTLLISSILQEIRCSLPEVQITFVGHSGRMLLLDGLPNADDVMSSDSALWQSLWAGTSQSKGDLLSFLSKFNKLIIYSVRTAERIKDLGIAGDRVLCLPAVPQAGRHDHILYYYLDLLQDLRGTTTLHTPVVSCCREKLPSGGSKRGPIIVHPGSGGREKRFSLDTYLELSEGIRERTGREIVFMLGPAESEVSTQDGIKAGGFTVRVFDDLRESVCFMSSSTGFIGNDSGMTHIAAALGIPTVAIFISTDPVVWRPLGGEVLVCDARSGGSPCRVFDIIYAFVCDK